MPTITINYVLTYELSFAPNYKWTEDGLCFNMKSGRLINKTMCGRSIGYCIQGKFYALNTLRKQLVKIKSERCPFSGREI